MITAITTAAAVTPMQKQRHCVQSLRTLLLRINRRRRKRRKTTTTTPPTTITPTTTHTAILPLPTVFTTTNKTITTVKCTIFNICIQLVYNCKNNSATSS